MFYIIQINDKGIPNSLISMPDFDKALDLAAKFARENGVDENTINNEIYESSQPGAFYSQNDFTDATGVWVISSDN